MPPKKQRSYPWLDGVRDQPIKESLRLLWDMVHDHSAQLTVADTVSATSDATLAELQAQITKLTKQITIISAGGGIATPSSVGGGGSSGSSGGSGPGAPGGGGGTSGGGQGGGANQDSHPDNTATVAQAIADLTTAGVSLVGSCGAFEIVKLVAWRLMSAEPGVGLLDKPSGNNCNGYATDIICYNDGVIYDILGDAGGANNPQWSFGGTVEVTRYRSPIPPAI